MARKNFSAETKLKCLLWCDRHCCLCRKACGVHIEVAHIDPDGAAEIDNAIPLCFDCHAAYGHYNRKHPRGNKYRDQEVKKRRNQIYEEYTRHLVPPISFKIVQQYSIVTDDHGEHIFAQRVLPDVGTYMEHLGDSLPVKVLVDARIVLCGRDPWQPKADYYCEKRPWNMNPHTGFYGHFKLRDVGKHMEGLKIMTRVTVIDQYERRHRLLPIEWRCARRDDLVFWVPEPSPSIKVKEWDLSDDPQEAAGGA